MLWGFLMGMWFLWDLIVGHVNLVWMFASTFEIESVVVAFAFSLACWMVSLLLLLGSKICFHPRVQSYLSSVAFHLNTLYCMAESCYSRKFSFFFSLFFCFWLENSWSWPRLRDRNLMFICSLIDILCTHMLQSKTAISSNACLITFIVLSAFFFSSLLVFCSFGCFK